MTNLALFKYLYYVGFFGIMAAQTVVNKTASPYPHKNVLCGLGIEQNITLLYTECHGENCAGRHWRALNPGY